MNRTKYFVIAVGLILLFLSCSGDKPQQQPKTQKVDLQVSLLKSSLAEQVNRVVLVILRDDAVFFRDTTLVVDGAFAFETVVLPVGLAIFQVSAIDEEGTVLFYGEDDVNIQPSEDVNVPMLLQPAVPMVKLSPYFERVTIGSPISTKLELFNLSGFRQGRFLITYDIDQLIFEGAVASNLAWGELLIEASFPEGGGVLLFVQRVAGGDDIPLNAPALIDINFQSLLPGRTDVLLSVEQLLDSQGLVPEFVDGSLYIDDQVYDIQTVTGFGSIIGIVTDAQTGVELAGVLVQATGPTDTSMTTELDGVFAFSPLALGQYHLTASLEGYISVSRDVTLQDPLLIETFSMRHPLGTNEYSVVLTWGVEPGDLDAHLWTYGYEVYYADFGSPVPTDSPYVYLDVDETLGFGPETITIYQLRDICVFAVKNYSGTPAITVSGAHVDVYQGSTLRQSFNIPTTGTGCWWYVFDLSASGVITERNLITDQDPRPSKDPGCSAP